MHSFSRHMYLNSMWRSRLSTELSQDWNCISTRATFIAATSCTAAGLSPFARIARRSTQYPKVIGAGREKLWIIIWQSWHQRLKKLESLQVGLASPACGDSLERQRGKPHASSGGAKQINDFWQLVLRRGHICLVWSGLLGLAALVMHVEIAFIASIVT